MIDLSYENRNWAQNVPTLEIILGETHSGTSVIGKLHKSLE